MAQQTYLRGRLCRAAGLVLFAALAVFAVPPSTAASAALQPAQGPVNISAFLFEPAAVTVNSGDSVTWLNTDGVPHTSTATTAHLWGGVMATGQTFTVDFDTPGTYSYYCEIHPAMIGQVTVVGT